MHERVDTIVLDTSACNVDLDPWRLCVELRRATNALVIALIRAGPNQDRVRAFRAGAFQCLTMPVSPSELAACLDNLTRPRRGLASIISTASMAPYVDPVLQIDIANRLVRRDGRVCSLSPREAALLHLLLQNKGDIVRNEDLGAAMWWGTAAATAHQRLKIYVSMLRQKIEHDPKHPSYIISHRGTGYGFIPQVNPDCSDDQAEATHAPSEPGLASLAAENGVDASEEQGKNSGLPSC